MIRNILVPIEDSEFSKAATHLAIQIAKEHDVQLSVMAVIDKPDIEKSLGAVPLGGMYYALKAEKKKLTEAETKARDLVDDFSKACKKDGVTCQLIVREGEPVEVISDEAKYHDLAIMGLKTLFKYGAKDDDNTLEGYLSHAGQPVIAVPKSYQPIRKILVAYDGTLPSARAIHSFLQFGIWNKQHVTLLNVHDDKEEGDLLLERMGSLLQTHQVNFEKIHMYGNPQEVILNYAKENDINLIALGAYGRDKITRFLFGDTTKVILENSEVPLFLDH